MKKLLVSLVVICGLIGMMAGTGMALTVSSGSIEVGSVDNLLDQFDLPKSGQATETAWVQQVLDNLNKDVDVVFEMKFEDIPITSWFETSVDGTWAFKLVADTNPGYFLIKTGEIKDKGMVINPGTDYLYENLISLDWAVVDLTTLGINPNNISKISHISTFNNDEGGGGGEGDPVPEPGTLLLLGSGLLGLAFYGRRLRK